LFNKNATDSNLNNDLKSIELEVREFSTTNEPLVAFRHYYNEGYYLTLKNGRIEMAPSDGTVDFKVRSSFRLRANVGGRIMKLAKSYRSLDQPATQLRSFFGL
jgi:hypothetical protein